MIEAARAKWAALGRFGKAAWSGVSSFVGSLGTAAVAVKSVGDIPFGAWVVAAGIGMVAAGGVYKIPYTPAPARK